jgi:hypothetical protein
MTAWAFCLLVVIEPYFAAVVAFGYNHWISIFSFPVMIAGQIILWTDLISSLSSKTSSSIIPSDISRAFFFIQVVIKLLVLCLPSNDFRGPSYGKSIRQENKIKQDADSMEKKEHLARDLGELGEKPLELLEN